MSAPSSHPASSDTVPSNYFIPSIFAGVKFLLHAWVNFTGGYGYFRDELYYLACADNPDFGYVDHPPLSIWLLTVSRLLIGDSLFALRLIPALAGAATVFVVGMIARQLGGGRTAQAFACLAATVSIIYLAMNSFYSMNSIDILLWSCIAFTVIRLEQTADVRWWLVLGFLIGAGMMNKIGIMWFAVGIYAGFLLTPFRHWLKTRWPWISLLLAFILFLPYAIWNIRYDFAHLEFMQNAMSDKYSSQTPLTFLTGQVLLQNPVTLPLWLIGIVSMFTAGKWISARILGVAFVTVMIILVLSIHAKPEYLSPAYGVLFASGGVALEKLTQRQSVKWIRYVFALVLCTGLGLAPAGIPVLPVETYIRYAQALGIQPSTAEGKELTELPQFYADMFGWPEKAEAVARVFQKLPPEDRERCLIYASNYGRCAAISFFGKQYGLPPVIGSHNSYWTWGIRDSTADILIILGGDEEDHRKVFADVSREATVSCRYCMPYENGLGVFLCRNPKNDLPLVWQRIKHFD